MKRNVEDAWVLCAQNHKPLTLDARKWDKYAVIKKAASLSKLWHEPVLVSFEKVTHENLTFFAAGEDIGYINSPSKL